MYINTTFKDKFGKKQGGYKNRDSIDSILFEEKKLMAKLRKQNRLREKII